MSPEKDLHKIEDILNIFIHQIRDKQLQMQLYNFDRSKKLSKNFVDTYRHLTYSDIYDLESIQKETLGGLINLKAGNPLKLYRTLSH